MVAGTLKPVGRAEPGMTPNELIAVHMQWRITLKFHLSQREAVPVDAMNRIRNEHACAIGKWLVSAATAGVRTSREYVELNASHSHFHRQMLRVAQSINGGSYVEAERLMAAGSDFESASRRLGNAIMAAGMAKMLPG